MSAASSSGNVIRKYLPVYFVLLAIFLVEVFLSFQHFSTGFLVPFSSVWLYAVPVSASCTSCILPRNVAASSSHSSRPPSSFSS
jgi:hypothetical protein